MVKNMFIPLFRQGWNNRADGMYQSAGTDIFVLIYKVGLLQG
jgi:hypothetical protein